MYGTKFFLNNHLLAIERNTENIPTHLLLISEIPAITTEKFRI
jgi:hypothetical protein